MAITAGSIYYRQAVNLYLPWYVNNHVNDLLCLPLVMGLLSSGLRCFKNDITFKFSLSFIMALVVYYSVYFEYYLPQVNSRYTGDLVDVLFYSLGGFLFYKWDRVRDKV